MLIRVDDLYGDTIHASDGEIGKIDDVLFDDEHWTVRYIVANTGGRLNSRKVLISPVALESVDWKQHVLNIKLTRGQVENSPTIDTAAPVSRQMETEYHDHFGWPYYWAGLGIARPMGVGGAGWNMGSLYAVTAADQVMTERAESDQGNADSVYDGNNIHLRNTRELNGYEIVAEDGSIGHVEGFIVDDVTWGVRYLAVDTRNWWPGKKVLFPPEWVVGGLWPDRTVTVRVTRDQVRGGPEYNPHEPISQKIDNEVTAYYGAQLRIASEGHLEPILGRP